MFPAVFQVFGSVWRGNLSKNIRFAGGTKYVGISISEGIGRIPRRIGLPCVEGRWSIIVVDWVKKYELWFEDDFMIWQDFQWCEEWVCMSRWFGVGDTTDGLFLHHQYVLNSTANNDRALWKLGVKEGKIQCFYCFLGDKVLYSNDAKKGLW